MVESNYYVTVDDRQSEQQKERVEFLMTESLTTHSITIYFPVNIFSQSLASSRSYTIHKINEQPKIK